MDTFDWEQKSVNKTAQVCSFEELFLLRLNFAIELPWSSSMFYVSINCQGR